jgi:hypothetical protein
MDWIQPLEFGPKENIKIRKALTQEMGKLCKRFAVDQHIAVVLGEAGVFNIPKSTFMYWQHICSSPSAPSKALGIYLWNDRFNFVMCDTLLNTVAK